MTDIKERSLFGVKVEPPLPGNGETPLENVRAELALLGYSLSAHVIHPDVNVTMPDEIAPNHVLRWSTLEALVAEAEARTSPSDPTELVAWLRALPVGTVLLDFREKPKAWMVQVFPHHSDADGRCDETVLVMTGMQFVFWRCLDKELLHLTEFAPFRVLHTPAGVS